MKNEQLHELRSQALAIQSSRVQVPQAANGCAVNQDLKNEGRKYFHAARAKKSLMMGTAALLLFTSGCAVSTVEPGQRGLKWNTDGLQRESLKDGVYWMAPWNDVYVYDVRWKTYTENVEVLSADNLQVTVKAGVILRPIPEDVYNLAQTLGSHYYERVVQPEFLSAIRNVVSGYPVLMLSEKSSEIAMKVQTVLDAKLKGRPLHIQSVALTDINMPRVISTAIEKKQATEQEKDQKQYELLMASKDAEIARARAMGERDAQGIRAEGQAKAQDTITKTLTPEYLRYKLYDSQNSKMVLIPDNLKLPIFINPGEHGDSPQPSARGSQPEKAKEQADDASVPPR